MKTRAQQTDAKAIPVKIHRHAVRKGEVQVLCYCGRGVFVLVKPEVVISLSTGKDIPSGLVIRCASCGKSELAK